MATFLAPPPKKFAEDADVGQLSMELVRDTAVVIPTYNAEKHWATLSAALDGQGLSPEQVLIIDSSSTDRTADLARAAGYRLISIPSAEFHHGKTRQLAATQLSAAEFLVYLTQDAVLAGPGTIVALLQPFHDARVGAVCGRQLARPGADAIEAHARLFNYPAASSVRGFDARHRLGIKAAFLSNSFAAYRRSALLDVGGFPESIIVAEDAVVAARLLMRGWTVAYQGEACVVHSHPLSLLSEFRRYFDTGVMHQQEPWLLETFGTAGGEGGRFVRSEMRYLARHAPLLLPKAGLRTLLKLVAYKLGQRQRFLPVWLRLRLTAQPNFWRQGLAGIIC